MTANPAAHPDAAALGPWFHNLHLDDGRVTRDQLTQELGDFPAWKWRELEPHLPRDLAGRRALDIGCNAGFYSFELAKRGAEVLGLDHDPHYLRQAEWARGQTDVTPGAVTFKQGDVYDLLATDECWDLILFQGVFYHLRYPLLALDAVADRLSPGGRIIFQSLTMPGDPPDADPPTDRPLNERQPMLDADFPKLAFIEHRWANDRTNWFAPNAAAVEAMLRSTGLVDLQRLGDECWSARRPEPGQAVTDRTGDNPRWWKTADFDRFRAAAGGQP
jgi:tRNA (mo5U34)-methyltransferase